MSAIDEIKARLDLVDIVSEAVQLKRAGRNFSGLCPFHNEKTPSFIVFPETQTWRCFGQCGEGGDMFSFVMKQQGWDFSEALRELAKRAGVELESQSSRHNPDEDDARNRLYQLLDITAEFYNDCLEGSPAEAYIHKRGLTPETARLFMLGYAPDDWSAALTYLTQLGFTKEEVFEAGVASQNESGRTYDRFRHRLMIPIRDGRGRTIGFGARALRDDQQPKYLNSPQGLLFDKSQTLYAFDLARRAIRETETAVIVEGYMDVIQAHQAGYTNVVAQMGTALTAPQLQLLSKYAHKIILSLDSDIAGMKATMRGLDTARETLGATDTYVLDTQGVMQQAGKLNLDVRVLELPSGKDPDDFIRSHPDGWPEQVTKALPLAEYVIKVGTQDISAGASVAERERRAHELLPLLTATEDNLERMNNIQLLSMKLRIDPRSMVQWAHARTRQTQTPIARNTKKDMRQQSMVTGSEKAMTLQPLQAIRGRALEQYCLAVLLRDPNRLFESNRLLREVLEDDTEALAREDFTQSDFQAIFALLQEACYQDEMEALDYIVAHAGEMLRSAIDAILPEPLEAYARHAARWQVTELESHQREKERRPFTLPDEFPRLLLKLRRDRIQQEHKEIHFLQLDSESDPLLESNYNIRSQELFNMTRLLDRAMHAKRLG